MVAYFVSDIHIRDISESSSEKLLLFLHQIKLEEECTHLFLVGDIFDLWIEDHKYFKQRYQPIVAAIRDLVNRDIEVHYFEGNHDLYLEKFWQQEVGAKVHEGPTLFELGPWKVRVEHGDEMNPEDKGYLFLRWFLRTPAMVKVAKYLPGQIVKRIGERASQTSRHYTSHQKSLPEEGVRHFMHDYAEKVFSEKAFDFLIAGHTHIRDQYLVEQEAQRGQSINLGSWFDGAKAFRLNDQQGVFIEL